MIGFLPLRSMKFWYVFVDSTGEAEVQPCWFEYIRCSRWYFTVKCKDEDGSIWEAITPINLDAVFPRKRDAIRAVAQHNKQ